MTRRPDTLEPQDAAAWVARLGSDQRTRADDEAFEAWLAADPAHASAYAEHAELWDGLSALTSAPSRAARASASPASALRPSHSSACSA